jgi:hypothetical protein
VFAYKIIKVAERVTEGLQDGVVAIFLQPFCNHLCNPYYYEYDIAIRKVAEKLEKNEVLKECILCLSILGQ